MEYKEGDPEESLGTRIEGEPQNGLTPYFVDMELVRAHYLKEGFKPTSRVMEVEAHKDWFISRDEDDDVTTVIKCTPRAVAETGVEYRDGKMVKNSAIGVARCDHTLMMADFDTIIRISYPREGLQHWRRIEARARQLVDEFVADTDKGAK